MLSGEELTAYRRDRVGFVFQFFNLVPTLTALENVQLLAEVTGTDAGRAAVGTCNRVGLADVADRFPRSCRVVSDSVCDRAGAGEGPAAGAVRRTDRQPRPGHGPAGARGVRDLAREGHHTVLLVTRDSAIARMADRIVRLHSGWIASDEHVDDPVEPRSWSGEPWLAGSYAGTCGATDPVPRGGRCRRDWYRGLRPRRHVPQPEGLVRDRVATPDAFPTV